MLSQEQNIESHLIDADASQECNENSQLSSTQTQKQRFFNPKCLTQNQFWRTTLVQLTSVSEQSLFDTLFEQPLLTTILLFNRLFSTDSIFDLLNKTVLRSSPILTQSILHSLPSLATEVPPLLSTLLSTLPSILTTPSELPSVIMCHPSSSFQDLVQRAFSADLSPTTDQHYFSEHPIETLPILFSSLQTLLSPTLSPSLLSLAKTLQPSLLSPCPVISQNVLSSSLRFRQQISNDFQALVPSSLSETQLPLDLDVIDSAIFERCIDSFSRLLQTLSRIIDRLNCEPHQLNANTSTFSQNLIQNTIALLLPFIFSDSILPSLAMLSQPTSVHSPLTSELSSSLTTIMNSLSSYISSHQDTQPDLFAFFTTTILEKIHLTIHIDSPFATLIPLHQSHPEFLTTLLHHHIPTAIHKLINFSENLDDDLQMKQGELYTRTIKTILFTTPRSSKPRLLQSEDHRIGEGWITPNTDLAVVQLVRANPESSNYITSPQASDDVSLLRSEPTPPLFNSTSTFNPVSLQNHRNKLLPISTPVIHIPHIPPPNRTQKRANPPSFSSQSPPRSGPPLSGPTAPSPFIPGPPLTVPQAPGPLAPGPSPPSPPAAAPPLVDPTSPKNETSKESDIQISPFTEGEELREIAHSLLLTEMSFQDPVPLSLPLHRLLASTLRMMSAPETSLPLPVMKLFSAHVNELQYHPLRVFNVLFLNKTSLHFQSDAARHLVDNVSTNRQLFKDLFVLLQHCVVASDWNTFIQFSLCLFGLNSFFVFPSTKHDNSLLTSSSSLLSQHSQGQPFIPPTLFTSSDGAVVYAGEYLKLLVSIASFRENQTEDTIFDCSKPFSSRQKFHDDISSTLINTLQTEDIKRRKESVTKKDHSLSTVLYSDHTIPKTQIEVVAFQERANVNTISTLHKHLSLPQNVPVVGIPPPSIAPTPFGAFLESVATATNTLRLIWASLHFSLHYASFSVPPFDGVSFIPYDDEEVPHQITFSEVTEHVLLPALRLLDITLNNNEWFLPLDGQSPHQPLLRKSSQKSTHTSPFDESSTFLDALFTKIDCCCVPSVPLHFTIPERSKTNSNSIVSFIHTLYTTRVTPSPFVDVLLSRILSRLAFVLPFFSQINIKTTFIPNTEDYVDVVTTTSNTIDRLEQLGITFSSERGSMRLLQTVIQPDSMFCVECCNEIVDSDFGLIANVDYSPTLQAINTSAILHTRHHQIAPNAQCDFWDCFEKPESDLNQQEHDHECDVKQEIEPIDNEDNLGDDEPDLERSPSENSNGSAVNTEILPESRPSHEDGNFQTMDTQSPTHVVATQEERSSHHSQTIDAPDLQIPQANEHHDSIADAVWESEHEMMIPDDDANDHMSEASYSSFGGLSDEEESIVGVETCIHIPNDEIVLFGKSADEVSEEFRHSQAILKKNEKKDRSKHYLNSTFPFNLHPLSESRNSRPATPQSSRSTESFTFEEIGPVEPSFQFSSLPLLTSPEGALRTNPNVLTDPALQDNTQTELWGSVHTSSDFLIDTPTRPSVDVSRPANIVDHTSHLTSNKVPLKRSYYLETCGHTIHATCLDRLVKKQRDIHQKPSLLARWNVPLRMDTPEFRCPVCLAVSNTIVPLTVDGPTSDEDVSNATIASSSVLKTALYNHGHNLSYMHPTLQPAQSAFMPIPNVQLTEAKAVVECRTRVITKHELPHLDFKTIVAALSQNPNISTPLCTYFDTLAPSRQSDCPCDDMHGRTSWVLECHPIERPYIFTSPHLQSLVGTVASIDWTLRPFALPNHANGELTTKPFRVVPEQQRLLAALFKELRREITNNSDNMTITSAVLAELCSMKTHALLGMDKSHHLQRDYLGSDPFSLLVALLSISPSNPTSSQFCDFVDMITSCHSHDADPLNGIWFNPTNTQHVLMTFYRRSLILFMSLFSDTENQKLCHLERIFSTLHPTQRGTSAYVSPTLSFFSPFSNVLQASSLGSSFSSPYFSSRPSSLLVPHLLSFPETQSSLSSFAAHAVCSSSHDKPHRSPFMAICPLCGQLLCVAAKCCFGPLKFWFSESDMAHQSNISEELRHSCTCIPLVVPLNKPRAVDIHSPFIRIISDLYLQQEEQNSEVLSLQLYSDLYEIISKRKWLDTLH
ncbi:hypothetical protein BLNAU_539 [Blattamonas nauphoetae]|uniref:E3 ubiquitin-protein ligase n=1 Tax=Blattamonas nauphoetae TaxID=2049346 RepID=A0ABQ9YLK1_9EUKA|nr:hypothetical protein BLNAU_539 [Blattamonas nauphoetae]